MAQTATAQRAAAERALANVLQDFGAIIYSVCRHRLAKSFGFAVEDAAAETALRLFRVFERQASAGQDIEYNAAFVRLVATRAAVSVFRRHIREIQGRQRLAGGAVSRGQWAPPQEAPKGDQLDVAGLSETEVAGLLRALPGLLGSLPERDRALLRLYYFSNPTMTWATIGERLDMRAAAARQAGRRALGKLAKLTRAELASLRDAAVSGRQAAS